MPDNDLQDVFLGRQPILDRDQQLFAYELLFRNDSAPDGNCARFSDGNQATATVISNAFAEFSMADALGPYQGFIKVDHGLLASELIDVLPPASVVLEIVDGVAATPELLARCEQLRASAYRLAVRERPGSPPLAQALREVAQIIKIDVGDVDPRQLAQLVGELKPLGKTMLAEKVESQAQMQFCRDLGFDLFQGYYFARPTVIQGKQLHPSELALLRLLGLLSQDADDDAIEAVFHLAPLLTLKLLRLINSASSGMATKITSLRHAITLLGRRQLLRWLQLLLYSNKPENRQTINPLLQLAATRGRLMELLVAHVTHVADDAAHASEGQRERGDQAYMVGILSLMPTLFASSMSALLAQLPVAAPVDAALASRDGTLGALLSLVERLENSSLDTRKNRPRDDPQRELLRRLPGIDAKTANACLAAALGWANNLARESF
jgi:c-di-GMP-related signal transduction protein